MNFVVIVVLQMKKHVSFFHERKKLLECELCDRRCSLKSTMQTHIESIHEGRLKNMILVNTVFLQKIVRKDIWCSRLLEIT